MLETFTPRRLDSGIIKPFTCEDGDLNDFFANVAIAHAAQLISVTWVFESKGHTAAFFSVSNDAIRPEEHGPETKARLVDRIPKPKTYPSLPAVKVARLGRHVAYHHAGLGDELMRFMKGFFLNKNKTGCRFITVDAYNKPAVLDYYARNSFVFFGNKDRRSRTRAMWCDLLPIAQKPQTLR